MPSFARATASSAPQLPLLEMTDDEAVTAVIEGDRASFEFIVRRYNSQLYRVGRAYLRNHAQTEDAMQNAYLKAFLNLNRFQGTAALATWLTRIMINECLMMLRRQKQCTTEPIDDDSAAIESFADPAAEILQAQEMKALLEQAIHALPRNHRAVYVLREIQHLTTAETARCLGLTRENVKVCLHRAREGLKTELLKSSAGLELFSYPARYCDPLTSKIMSLVQAAPPPAA
jgi:RNA polymerase sigma factor (sigma-70 family)